MNAAVAVEWRQVTSHPEYEVSSDGRVRHGHRILVGGLNSQGYRSVHLTRFSTAKVHTLVAEAFLGPRPKGLEIRHLNDVRDDNRVENLAYGTHSENMRDRVRNGHDRNGAATHCHRGHEFNSDNTYVSIRSNGQPHRMCRTCHRESSYRNSPRRKVERAQDAA